MKKEILIGAMMLVPSLAFAHGDHAAPIAQCLAKDCVKSEIETAVPSAIEALVSSGKLDKNWSSAKVDEVALKTFKKSSEWRVTLSNPGQKEKRYIFITKSGLLNGVNSSGE